MKPEIVLERLKKRLEKLETEKQKLIEQIMKFKSTSGRYTKTARIINEIIYYLGKTKYPKSTASILEYLRVTQGAFWGKDKSALLSAMLNNEAKRKYARIIKAERGYYMLSQNKEWYEKEEEEWERKHKEREEKIEALIHPYSVLRLNKQKPDDERKGV